MSRFTMASTLLTLVLSACTALGLGDTDSPVTGQTCVSSGQTCQVNADCPSDEECEDGACKLHGSACESDDNSGSGSGSGSGSDDGPQGTECVLDADCGALECEDGFCVPHGGNH